MVQFGVRRAERSPPQVPVYAKPLSGFDGFA
jgi:hypothetical protein